MLALRAGRAWTGRKGRKGLSGSSRFSDDPKDIGLLIGEAIEPGTRHYIKFPHAESNPAPTFLTDRDHLKPLPLFQHEWLRAAAV